MELTSTATLQEPEGMTESMRTAFARMFADADFRGLLIHLMQKANKGVLDAIHSDIEKSKVYATRYNTYSRMYELGQYYFKHFEKIKEARKKNQVDKK